MVFTANNNIPCFSRVYSSTSTERVKFYVNRHLFYFNKTECWKSLLEMRRNKNMNKAEESEKKITRNGDKLRED